MTNEDEPRSESTTIFACETRGPTDLRFYFQTPDGRRIDLDYGSAEAHCLAITRMLRERIALDENKAKS